MSHTVCIHSVALFGAWAFRPHWLAIFRFSFFFSLLHHISLRVQCSRYFDLKMANIGDEQALKLLLRAQKRLEGNSSSPQQSDENQNITTQPLSTPRETTVRAVARPEKTTKAKVSKMSPNDALTQQPHHIAK